jgi:hypothetical protein
MAQNSSGFAFQKYGERLLIRIVSIEKKEVMESELKNVNDLLVCATKELKALGVIHPWNMTISGYDFDPRSLAEIPEVVSWFKKVQEVHPYLPIFLSPFILNSYLLSQLDLEMVKTVKKTDLTEREKKEIDTMAAILNRNEQGLGEKYRKQMEYKTQYRVNMQQVRELNNQISFTAEIYLSLYEVSKPVREKSLRDAFVRINSAFDLG